MASFAYDTPQTFPAENRAELVEITFRGFKREEGPTVSATVAHGHWDGSTFTRLRTTETGVLVSAWSVAGAFLAATIAALQSRGILPAGTWG